MLSTLDHKETWQLSEITQEIICKQTDFVAFCSLALAYVNNIEDFTWHRVKIGKSYEKTQCFQ